MDNIIITSLIGAGGVISGAVVTAVMNYKNNQLNSKNERMKWYSNSFLQNKVDVISKCQLNLAKTINVIEYFCGDTGRSEMKESLNLKYANPYQEPKVWKFDYREITEKNKEDYIELTNSKAREMETLVAELQESLELIKVYLNDEEAKVIDEISRLIKEINHQLTNTIKKFNVSMEGDELASILNAYSHFDGFYAAIISEKRKTLKIISKHLYPEQLREIEK
ncbi:hypothetical protein [Bacillus dicomae]|uniref:Uncharacterized protein n=1 Tax=Bacillus dicomae TaxID=3088378 RepID=A0AC61T7H7_9BACI|nr:hypothetical protein [Bacillus dicomae]TPV44565.1 hypothetical protein FJ659_15315 [Bacillus dicomae]